MRKYVSYDWEIYIIVIGLEQANVSWKIVVVIHFITGYQTTVWSAKNTLNFSNNRLQLYNELGDAHLLLSNCDKLDKMQLVTEFKKLCVKGSVPP